MSSRPPKYGLLYVTDIFHIILDCLAEPYPYGNDTDLVRVEVPRKEGQRALAALAQTCRILSEPSLNYLWRKMHTLGPLLQPVYPGKVDRENLVN